MQATQTPRQAGSPELNERNEEMNGNQKSAQIKSAPLYASPWLAFFYLIRQGLEQFRL